MKNTRNGFVVALAMGLLTTSAFAQEGSKARPENKPQSAVAAKDVTFGTITATDAKVKAATPVENLDAARKLMEKEGTFVGTVTQLFTPKGNGLVIFNFAKNYRNAISAVVNAKDYARFPDLKALEGKKILFTGKVIDYKGRPEVELKSPEQVKLVK